MNPFAALSNGSSDEDSANEEVDPDVEGPHTEPGRHPLSLSVAEKVQKYEAMAAARAAGRQSRHPQGGRRGQVRLQLCWYMGSLFRGPLITAG